MLSYDLPQPIRHTTISENGKRRRNFQYFDQQEQHGRKGFSAKTKPPDKKPTIGRLKI